MCSAGAALTRHVPLQGGDKGPGWCSLDPQEGGIRSQARRHLHPGSTVPSSGNTRSGTKCALRVPLSRDTDHWWRGGEGCWWHRLDPQEGGIRSQAPRHLHPGSTVPSSGNTRSGTKCALRVPLSRDTDHWWRGGEGCWWHRLDPHEGGIRSLATSARTVVRLTADSRRPPEMSPQKHFISIRSPPLRGENAPDGTSGTGDA